MRARDRVHHFVDELPENELAAVERFLRGLRDERPAGRRGSLLGGARQRPQRRRAADISRGSGHRRGNRRDRSWRDRVRSRTAPCARAVSWDIDWSRPATRDLRRLDPQTADLHRQLGPGVDRVGDIEDRRGLAVDLSAARESAARSALAPVPAVRGDGVVAVIADLRAEASVPEARVSPRRAPGAGRGEPLPVSG